MNRTKHKLYISLLASLLTAAALCGCGVGAQTKTIILPPQEDTDVNFEKIQISHIEEFSLEGSINETLYPSLGIAGESQLYMMKREEDGSSMCLTVDTQRNEITDGAYVDDCYIFSLTFSPNGKYFSYEVSQEDTTQLMIFSMETKSSQMIHEYSNYIEYFKYVWSDDGSCLFSWQNGDISDPYADWQLTRCQMIDNADGSLQVEKTQLEMPGSGFSERSVLPNADGSEVYVREEFEPFESPDKIPKASKGNEAFGYDANALADNSAANMDNIEEERLSANNWLILPDAMTMIPLPEYSRKAVAPIQYTSAGLFVRDEDGILYLIEDIKKQQKPIELFQTAGMQVYVCANGDHVFFTEWVNSETYQVSGARISDGEASGRWILYKNTYESINQIILSQDHTLILSELTYSEDNEWNGKYSLRATLLEY